MGDFTFFQSALQYLILTKTGSDRVSQFQAPKKVSTLGVLRQGYTVVRHLAFSYQFWERSNEHSDPSTKHFLRRFGKLRPFRFVRYFSFLSLAPKGVTVYCNWPKATR